ncbi:MAG: hypothetical protein ABJ327_08025, partial [Litoreibacter sp.]
IRNWRHENQPGYTLNEPLTCPKNQDHFSCEWMAVLGGKLSFAACAKLPAPWAQCRLLLEVRG